MQKKTHSLWGNSFTVAIILAMLMTSFVVAASPALGTWTPGTFAIYVLDVEQGDSQFIVSPSGKTMLIDVGETNWNSSAGATYVNMRLQEIMGAGFSHIDYLVLTHLHSDHLGYVEYDSTGLNTTGYGGIYDIVETYGYTIGKMIDRDSGVWVDTDDDGICHDEFTEITWNNIGDISNTGTHWVCYATDPDNATKLNRETPIVGSTTQIDMGSDVTVTIIMADADGVMMENKTTPVSGNHYTDVVPPSENDYSIVLKLTYGSLDYVTGGDLDGQYATSGYGYTYNDEETVAAPRIGDIDVLRVNHHGSSHSSNQYYLDTLSPTVSLISVGDNDYLHPDPNTLDRLLAVSDVYLTNLGDPLVTTADYGDSTIVGGDILVKSTDGVNYTINGTPYVATNPPVYGVDVTPATAALGVKRGTIATYTLTIQNIGNATDTFNIALSGNAWYTTVTPTTPITLAPLASATITVKVTVPSNARIGTTDKVTVKFTSSGNSSKSDSAVLTTTARLR